MMKLIFSLVILASTMTSVFAQTLKTDDPIGRFLFANTAQGKTYLGYYCLKRETSVEGKQDCAESQFVIGSDVQFTRDFLGNTNASNWKAIGPVFTRESGKQFFDSAAAGSYANAFNQVWNGIWNWETGWQNKPLQIDEASLTTFSNLLNSIGTDEDLTASTDWMKDIAGWWEMDEFYYLFIENKSGHWTISSYNLRTPGTNTYLPDFDGRSILKRKWKVSEKEGLTVLNGLQRISFKSPDNSDGAYVEYHSDTNQLEVVYDHFTSEHGSPMGEAEVKRHKIRN